MISLLSCIITVSVFFAFCSGELTCPQCDGLCEDVGFFSCKGCMCQLTCQDMNCEDGLVCLLKEVDCLSEPCPKLPNCVSVSTVCNGKTPLLDKSLSPVPCGSNCPDSHDCVEGICCDQNEIPQTITPGLTVTDFGIPIDTLGGNPPPCFGCPFSPCSVAPCLNHVNAICKGDNCTCLYWYEDEMGNHLDCSGSELDDPSQEPTQTTFLETQKEKEGSNDALKYGIIAACAFVIALFLVFLLYKLIEKKRKRQQRCSADVEEQKVPLKEVPQVNGENNNQEKREKISQETSENDATTSNGVEA